MRAAGLTHGGFYKHFADREELIYEAIEHALRENETNAAQVVADADDPLAAFAEWYVSAAHRDNPAEGCGVAALCTDVPRLGGDHARSPTAPRSSATSPDCRSSSPAMIPMSAAARM